MWLRLRAMESKIHRSATLRAINGWIVPTPLRPNYTPISPIHRGLPSPYSLRSLCNPLSRNALAALCL